MSVHDLVTLLVSSKFVEAKDIQNVDLFKTSQIIFLLLMFCPFSNFLFVLQDPKRHLEEHVDVLMTSNIVQCLAAMLDTVVFQWWRYVYNC